MSSEGYYLVLCKQGHLSTQDLWWNREKWRCSYCKQPAAFEQHVDTTNGNDLTTGKCPGDINFDILDPGKKCTCKDCGNEHYCVPPRYKIPMFWGVKEAEENSDSFIAGPFRNKEDADKFVENNSENNLIVVKLK